MATRQDLPTRTLEALLRVSSRTFAIGIERLPASPRDAVRVAYLLLRISDYLEDNEQMAPAEKAERLRLWERVLAGGRDVAELTAGMPLPDPLTPDAEVAASADLVLAAARALPERLQEPILRHVRDSTLGMARWAERGPRIATESDLDDYMHEVAGRVGYLLTEVFAAEFAAVRRQADRLMPLAREFGLGLQTVNVIRGLRSDLERGWIFVPESFVAPHGIGREALFEPGHAQQALAVLDRLADKAERHLAEARRYVQALPRLPLGLRLFCVLPLLFAVRTLAISRGNVDVLRDEVKISRAEVRAIVRSAALGAWSNAWIGSACRRLARPPAPVQ